MANMWCRRAGLSILQLISKSVVQATAFASRLNENAA